MKRLPPTFSGVEPAALFDALQNIAKKLEKDEYETTAEHQKRLDSSLPAKISAGTTTESIFAVVLPEKPGIRSEYDADSECLTFEIEAPATRSLEDYPKLIHHVMIRQSGTQYQSGVGQNAFGGVVAMSTAWFMRYGLVLTNARQMAASVPWARFVRGDDEMDMEIKIVIPISSSVARAVKPSLRALLLLMPDRPFVSIGTQRLPATVDNPREQRFTLNFIHGKLTQVWLFSTKTGDVIAKYVDGKLLEQGSMP